MSTPALLALESPGEAPAAALARLLATGQALTLESAARSAGGYGPFLALGAALARRLSPLLAVALAGQASEAETAALLSGERVAAAGAALCHCQAVRTRRGERVAAMRWAALWRRLYADTALTRREFAPTLTYGLDVETATRSAPIRILPGAEPAVAQLLGDALAFAPDLDLSGLADSLARWVRVA